MAHRSGKGIEKASLTRDPEEYVWSNLMYRKKLDNSFDIIVCSVIADSLNEITKATLYCKLRHVSTSAGLEGTGRVVVMISLHARQQFAQSRSQGFFLRVFDWILSVWSPHNFKSSRWYPVFLWVYCYLHLLYSALRRDRTHEKGRCPNAMQKHYKGCFHFWRNHPKFPQKPCNGCLHQRQNNYVHSGLSCSHLLS